MSLTFILVPFAILLGIAALIGFIWAVRSGQFDDLETPKYRMLFDECTKPKEKGKTGTDKQQN